VRANEERSYVVHDANELLLADEPHVENVPIVEHFVEESLKAVHGLQVILDVAAPQVKVHVLANDLEGHVVHHLARLFAIGDSFTDQQRVQADHG